MSRTPKAQTLESHLTQIIAQAAREILSVLRNGLGHDLDHGAKRASAPSPAAHAPAPEKPAAGSATVAHSDKAAGKAGSSKPRRRRGRKSGPNAVTLEKVVTIIRATPNLRSEQIQKVLGLPQAQVKAALTKLRATDRVKTSGARRATTYSAS